MGFKFSSIRGRECIRDAGNGGRQEKGNGGQEDSTMMPPDTHGGQEGNLCHRGSPGAFRPGGICGNQCGVWDYIFTAAVYLKWLLPAVNHCFRINAYDKRWVFQKT